ncbi:MAG: hypothetical protein COV60_02235 [Candidatus Magasanikbacteria bacterium CG11_big_fil_rev_8_21_14_0_20_43_7]|uniref:Uncharacterized protein n=1 Tax=Candidatus Magasanikbacteria bacterium CG11_big_fil_rev_8_21_14_0_20_43_7 TaxID=1974654 RepID=A0A2H0N2G7_9BACT|nr:MAG: hypothetical protein COV60_02235 [Candidatus Magasanikbacteria bacterium CG11_big_fil_rev_8_21_14_0_20_43_7]
MRYGVKKLPDIRAPNKTIGETLYKLLRSLNGTEQSFASTTRPRIIDKRVIKTEHQIIIQQTMYHSISNRSD